MALAGLLKLELCFNHIVLIACLGSDTYDTLSIDTVFPEDIIHLYAGEKM